MFVSLIANHRLKQRLPRPKLALTYLALALLCSFSLVGVANATDPSSTNYKISESHFGAGGSLHDCSGNYCAKSSVGDLTVGRGSSTNYSAYFGFNTEDRPQLEVMALGGSQDMGVLKPDRTGTAVFAVNVRSYLSSGYVLLITGATPSVDSHNLASPSTPTVSTQGKEQFGLNLVANTTPNIGVDPVQVPSGDFSFGQANANYSQPDKFMYQDGDAVARSDSSSGQTNYTISMIANISQVTPAGYYDGSFSAVAVPTF